MATQQLVDCQFHAWPQQSANICESVSILTAYWLYTAISLIEKVQVNARFHLSAKMGLDAEPSRSLCALGRPFQIRPSARRVDYGAGMKVLGGSRDVKQF